MPERDYALWGVTAGDLVVLGLYYLIAQITFAAERARERSAWAAYFAAAEPQTREAWTAWGFAPD